MNIQNYLKNYYVYKKEIKTMTLYEIITNPKYKKQLNPKRVIEKNNIVYKGIYVGYQKFKKEGWGSYNLTLELTPTNPLYITIITNIKLYKAKTVLNWLYEHYDKINERYLKEAVLTKYQPKTPSNNTPYTVKMFINSEYNPQLVVISNELNKKTADENDQELRKIINDEQ